MPDPILRVDGLSVHYQMERRGLFAPKRVVHAVEGVSFEIAPGTTLGLVGESGSGKTTTGRAVLRKVPATAGRIYFDGRDITEARGKTLRRLRRDIQVVFQDPYASLNPRMTIAEIIAEPLIVQGLVRGVEEALPRIHDLLDITGLSHDAAHRYPHAFSGGQRQRVGIARAIALEPRFLVADEPVSALDVSIRAQVVNLLKRLQADLGITYLFIAHDLSIVRHISHEIAVMYAGKLVEIADSLELYREPHHPYTQALLSAVPEPDPSEMERRSRIVLQGEVPDPISPPTGCRFHTRCPYRVPGTCDIDEPKLREVAPGHRVACHFAEEILAKQLRGPTAVAQLHSVNESSASSQD